MTVMLSAARRRWRRAAHWSGAAMVAPLLILAGWAALEGWHQPDPDDRNEFYGVAPLAALAAYGVARVVGWFLTELLD
jgi:hypothetical protein